MTGLVLYDSIQNSQFPPGGDAYAGYVDGGIGDQPNYNWVTSAFAHARHLSIALFADHDADALDVENGAAQPSDVPGWHARQVRRGISRPVIYASAYTMQTSVLAALSAAGIQRASVRLWTAHYSGQAHICSPRSCEALSTGADGTQWSNNAMGRVLDQSLLLDSFFGAAPAPSVPSWQEALMQALPTVREGSTGGIVRTVQGLCCARGHAVAVDGSYGSKTAAAVRSVQAAARIAQDGIVGPVTWAALLGV